MNESMAVNSLNRVFNNYLYSFDKSGTLTGMWSNILDKDPNAKLELTMKVDKGVYTYDIIRDGVGLYLLKRGSGKALLEYSELSVDKSTAAFMENLFWNEPSSRFLRVGITICGLRITYFKPVRDEYVDDITTYICDSLIEMTQSHDYYAGYEILPQPAENHSMKKTFDA